MLPQEKATHVPVVQNFRNPTLDWFISNTRYVRTFPHSRLLCNRCYLANLQIDALNAQNARLFRDHQQTVKKYQDKISHNESTIKCLVKDNVALQSQLSTEQKAHRSVCQRETALRAAVRCFISVTLTVAYRSKDSLGKRKQVPRVKLSGRVSSQVYNGSYKILRSYIPMTSSELSGVYILSRANNNQKLSAYCRSYTTEMRARCKSENIL